ncbi:helix-turn-helix transcriptional regulator [Streptomyces sp. NPDC057575]|uniref:helix-turn-helix transcriptional regulator n=1 Tax=unclassified Streptomyces TaxID=2593676 RepID=UPI0036AF259A
MSQNHEEEVPELLTIPEIAKRCGLSRQRVHGIAKSDPEFPSAVITPGTTRAKYSTKEVDEYFESRVLRPGRRTDLEQKKGAADEDPGKDGTVN